MSPTSTQKYKKRGSAQVGASNQFKNPFVKSVSSFRLKKVHVIVWAAFKISTRPNFDILSFA